MRKYLIAIKCMVGLSEKFELQKSATKSATNKKKASQSIDYQCLLKENVIPLGLEPKTHTLKVYCSTN